MTWLHGEKTPARPGGRLSKEWRVLRALRAEMVPDGAGQVTQQRAGHSLPQMESLVLLASSLLSQTKGLLAVKQERFFISFYGPVLAEDSPGSLPWRLGGRTTYKVDRVWVGLSNVKVGGCFLP